MTGQGGCQCSHTQQVIRDSVRQLGDGISRCGCDQQDITVVAQINVNDMAFTAPKICFRVGFLSAYRLEGQRADEFLGCFGQYCMNDSALFG